MVARHGACVRAAGAAAGVCVWGGWMPLGLPALTHARTAPPQRAARAAPRVVQLDTPPRTPLRTLLPLHAARSCCACACAPRARASWRRSTRSAPTRRASRSALHAALPQTHGLPAPETPAFILFYPFKPVLTRFCPFSQLWGDRAIYYVEEEEEGVWGELGERLDSSLLAAPSPGKPHSQSDPVCWGVGG